MIWLALLILAEILVRIFKFAPAIPKGQNIYAKVDGLTFGLKPNIEQRVEVSTGDSIFLVRHNNMGIRDVEHKKKKVFRILAVGDSFTYGWGCQFEDTFLYNLEKWLGIDIIKAGIPGYEIADCRKFVNKYYDVYEPDLVLLCVAPNDALCVSGKHSVTKDGYLIYESFLYKMSLFLFKYSCLARIIIKLIARQNFPLDYDLEKIKEEILLIRKIAKNIVVLFLPDRVIPPIMLREFCAFWKIPFIDAYFSEEYNFLKDGHCNSAGNDTIARLAYRKLHKIISAREG